MLLEAALFGFIGGLTRACVGFIKNSYGNKKIKFNSFAFWFTFIASGIIGVFAGLVVSTNFALALLAGYAGTDLIENIYKIKRKIKVKI
jgi:hypothetical protein